jgi:FeS assembly protein IscX
MSESFTWKYEDRNRVAEKLRAKFPDVNLHEMPIEELRRKVIELEGFNDEPKPKTDDGIHYLVNQLRFLKDGDERAKERYDRDVFINHLSPESRANYLRSEVCP